MANFYSTAPFIKENYPEYYSIESYPADRCACIRKVDEEWGVLGNFGRTPLTVEGVAFKTSEELYQLMKFKDAEIIGRIRNNITRAGKTCYHVKKTVRSYEKDFRRNDWGNMIVDAMKYCLTQKWEQSKEFRDTLMASKERGLYIVEDQSSFPRKEPDTWGVKLVGENYVGPNLLGRLLMELRDNGRLEYTLPSDALDFIEMSK